MHEFRIDFAALTALITSAFMHNPTSHGLPI